MYYHQENNMFSIKYLSCGPIFINLVIFIYSFSDLVNISFYAGFTFVGIYSSISFRSFLSGTRVTNLSMGHASFLSVMSLQHDIETNPGPISAGGRKEILDMITSAVHTAISTISTKKKSNLKNFNSKKNNKTNNKSNKNINNNNNTSSSNTKPIKIIII